MKPEDPGRFINFNNFPSQEVNLQYAVIQINKNFKFVTIFTP